MVSIKEWLGTEKKRRRERKKKDVNLREEAFFI